MGRPRAFDEIAVLTGAMEAFRRKGYFAVSIKDLEEATGLKAGSIYNSYGDKAGLFRAATTHYHCVVLHQRIADRAPEAAGLGGLRSLFVSLLHEPGGTSYGCLITNTAVEFACDDSAPVDVGYGLRVLSETFNNRLLAARRAGLLRSELKPAQCASKLLALYQGVLVLVRAGWDKTALEKMIDAEFNQLGAKQ
jgi:TetR/AcrR family transcriptional regulator, transcriptional repressor for nem operon